MTTHWNSLSSPFIIVPFKYFSTPYKKRPPFCALRPIKSGDIFNATTEHYFDCPYQLSSEITGQTYLYAMVCSVELMEGDIIITGTDALFDKVFDQEIISIVYRFKDTASAGGKPDDITVIVGRVISSLND